MITRAISRKGFTLYAGHNGDCPDIAVIINSENQTLARAVNDDSSLEFRHNWKTRREAVAYVESLFYPTETAARLLAR